MVYRIDLELFILRRRNEFLNKCIEWGQTCEYRYDEQPDFERDDWFKSLRVEYRDGCQLNNVLEALTRLRQ